MKLEITFVSCTVDLAIHLSIGWVPIYLLPANEMFVLCLLLRMHFTIMFSEVFVKSICTSKQIYATQPFYHCWNTQYGRHFDNTGRLIPVMKRKDSKPASAKLAFRKCKKACLKNCPCAKAGPASIVVGRGPAAINDHKVEQ